VHTPPRFQASGGSRRRARRLGFTLVELAVALGVVGVLIAIALPMFKGWQEKVRTKKAVDDVQAISAVIDGFHADTGRFPASLAEIKRDTLRDPWGNPYVYLDLTTTNGNGHARKDHSLVPLNTDFDLYSSGPDGSSSPPLTAQASRDDILRANNGRFVGPASQY
jgi:general secretion pathway protein G